METIKIELESLRELSIDEKIKVNGGSEASDNFCYLLGMFVRGLEAFADGARHGSGYGIYTK